MGVENSLVKKKTQMYQGTQTATYEAGGQKIELTPEIIRKYLVSGDKEKVSFEEIIMFMNMCKFNGLNPWAKEAYCIKFGNEPAQMITSKEAYLKRAEENPAYDGAEAGITVVNPDTSEVVRRVGSFSLKGEEIVGGWAKVWRKDRSHCYESEVSFDEYAGRKKDGTLNSQWKKKPATMIRKVALVQALREAFPTSIGGMCIEEEAGIPAEFAEVASTAIENLQGTEGIETHETPQEVFQQKEQPVPEPVVNITTTEGNGQQSFF